MPALCSRRQRLHRDGTSRARSGRSLRLFDVGYHSHVRRDRAHLEFGAFTRSGHGEGLVEYLGTCVDAVEPLIVVSGIVMETREMPDVSEARERERVSD